MTRVNRIASNKQKLDMILLCIAYQASLGWSNLVGNCLAWFGLVQFGLEWKSLVWLGGIWFVMNEFGLL